MSSYDFKQSARLVNIEVAIIADTFRISTVILAILLQRSIDKVSLIFFWLEISIKTIDTLQQAAASTCALRYRGARHG